MTPYKDKNAMLTPQKDIRDHKLSTTIVQM